MTAFNPKDRNHYKFWVPEHVRFADLEPQNHVNNMIVGAYFQSGRVALMATLGVMRKQKDRTIVIARAINDYFAELTYPNTLSVGVAVSHIGNTSFTLRAGVFVDNLCYAAQEAICVYWNPMEHHKIPLGPEHKTALQAYYSGD